MDGWAHEVKLSSKFGGHKHCGSGDMFLVVEGEIL